MITNLLRTIENNNEVIFDCILTGILIIIVVIFGLSAVLINLCRKRKEQRTLEELEKLHWCCDCKYKANLDTEWPCNNCTSDDNHWEYNGDINITEED